MDKPRQSQFARYFEQYESSRDISLNYRCWIVNAPVDVGLGGKINDCIAAAHSRFYGNCVANVAFDKAILRLFGDPIEVGKISGVSQLVIVHDSVALDATQNVS